MTAKDEYRALCEEPGLYVPLFQQHWWMEAACVGKRWEVLLARDEQGTIQAALPTLVGSKCGLRYLLQPELTLHGGIWYRYDERACADERHRLQYEERWANAIIAQLHGMHALYFQHNFSPAITNWAPFYHAGYRQTTRYTYRLEQIDDIEAVRQGFSRNERWHRIARLDDSTSLQPMSAAAFAAFQQECRQRAGQRNLVRSTLVEHLCDSALRRNQALCVALVDDRQQRLAALFVPYDKHNAYYLIPAVIPEAVADGAMETLVWKVLQQLSGHVAAFDFEGSMIYGVERFYRSFGAKQTPLHKIWKWRP